MEYPHSVADKFWSKVEKTDGCWNWKSGCDSDGYGRFGRPTGLCKSHRIAWTLSYGIIPPGLCVLHKCDNRACCRPDHLFLGTNADNTTDRTRKGRSASGDRSGRRLHPDRFPRGDDHPLRKNPEKAAHGDRSGPRRYPERYPRGDRHYTRLHPETVQGERNGKAKITVEQVRDIRERAHSQSGAQISRDMGIAYHIVACVIARKTWAHVD